MFKLQKINDKKVKPVQVTKIDPNKIKGYDLFPEIYANIFLCAKKKSGKTSVIHTILKECIDKETRVFVFCATHNKDESYKHIKKMLENKKVRNIFYDSIVDEDNVNNLDLIIKELRKESEFEDEDIVDEKGEEIQSKIIDVDNEGNIKIKNKKKPSKLSPKIVFVFDDISDELKNKYVPKLLKTNRHFKSKVIVSSQYPLDTHPGSRKQFDYWILFKGHEDAKLETIYQNASLPIDFELFKKMYHKATSEKYNFLYIDCVQNEYRSNFDKKIISDSLI